MGWLAGLLALAGGAWAQAPREHYLDMPRQQLWRAVGDFFRQTGTQIAYVPKSDREQNTLVGPLKGRYTVEAALTELLKPAGLTFKWTDERTVAVVEPPPKPPPRKVPTSSRIEPVDVAEPSLKIEKILVHGSRLWGLSSLGIEDGAAPGLVFDRKAIENLGVSTVPDLMRYIPQHSYMRFEGHRPSGAQYTELRGLGIDTTLVLINGRRAIPSATSILSNAVDLNAIPISAVDRVEVLPDFSSVMHGAETIGGVLNIVLRDDTTDPFAELHYGASAGGAAERRVAARAGAARDEARVSAVLDYFQRDALFGSERDLTSNADFRRFGGRDWRSPMSNPGNVYSLTGNDLPGLPASFAAVLAGSTGAGLTPADFQNSAGQRNLESLFRYWSVVPETERLSGFVSARMPLSWSSVFTELLYSDRTTVFQVEPPMVAGVVPGSSPFNPFGETVGVNYLVTGIGPRGWSWRTELYRALAGFEGRYHEWDWELSLLRAEEDGRLRFVNELDPVRVAAALAETDPARALNVFQDGPGADREMLASLIEPKVQQSLSRGSQATMRLHGSPWRLPAGNASVLLGAEWREEETAFNGVPVGALERSVSSAFAQLQFPLVSADMEIAAIDELAVMIAGRLDRYSDVGTSTTAQAALLWQPSREVKIRASYGTSFRPPAQHELFLPLPPLLIQVSDPRRNNEIATVTLLAGGNPDLMPTNGSSSKAGFAYMPEAVRKLKLSADYWSIHVRDRIAPLPLSVLLAHEESFPNRIARAEPSAEDNAAGLPGALLRLDSSRLNFGRLEASGIDVTAAYTFDTPVGELNPNLSLTWVGEYRTTDVPGAWADRVGVASASGTIPRWHAVGRVEWEIEGVSLSATARFASAYDDIKGEIRNGRVIPAQTTIDLQASLELDQVTSGGPLSRGIKLTAGALNAFDHRPHFAEVGGEVGHDVSQGDLRGRFVYLRLAKSF